MRAHTGIWNFASRIPGKQGRKMQNAETENDDETNRSDQIDLKSKKHVDPPPCLHPQCEVVDDIHWFRNCRQPTEIEKMELFKQIAKKKSRDGPSISTLWQQANNKIEDTTTAATTTYQGYTARSGVRLM